MFLQVARNQSFANSVPASLRKIVSRGGVKVIEDDCAYANQLCDVKMPTMSRHPCAQRLVHRDGLGNWRLNKEELRRSLARIE